MSKRQKKIIEQLNKQINSANQASREFAKMGSPVDLSELTSVFQRPPNGGRLSDWHQAVNALL